MSSSDINERAWVSCPSCKGSGEVESPARWLLDLRYLAKQRDPIWGGPMSRGEDILTSDPSLRYCVNQGYVEPMAGRGFVITKKGREIVRQLGGTR